MIEKQKIAAQARQWINVPYRHRGTTRQGCDCTGLLIGVARELGYLKHFKLRKYKQDWNLGSGADDQVIKQLKKMGDLIGNSQADIGDIIVMNFGRCGDHCGILVDVHKKLMIHCYRTLKKCRYGILRNSRWSRRWIQTYRIDEQKLAKF